MTDVKPLTAHEMSQVKSSSRLLATVRDREATVDLLRAALADRERDLADAVTDAAKLRAELERVYNDLSTRGNEVMRLRAFMGDAMLAYYDKMVGHEPAPAAYGGQKTSEAMEPGHCTFADRGCWVSSGDGCRCPCADCNPAIHPRATSGGEAKDAKGPPERLHVCRYENGDTALTAPMQGQFNPLDAANWNANYVRAELHAAAIARAEATADQFARYRNAARELRKTLESEADAASRDRDDLLAALRNLAMNGPSPCALSPQCGCVHPRCAATHAAFALLAKLDAERESGSR